MRSIRTMGGLMVAAVLGLAVATNASAQQPAVPDAHEPIEITDELLERFVVVYPAVVTIAQAAQAEMAAAESADQAQAIQTNAQGQIMAALEENRFTVEEYEAVVMTLNEDEELRTRFEEMLEAYLTDG